MEEIVNKVAQSGLISFDLEKYYPKGERALIDIKENLWQGIALKEKDFRSFIKENDWSAYQDKYVAVICSEDAIIPTWAYMLVTSALNEFAKKVVFGSLEDLENEILIEVINNIDISEFEDKRVIVKGCSNLPIPTNSYVKLTEKMLPVVKTLMFGEACSSVPLYKKKK